MVDHQHWEQIFVRDGLDDVHTAMYFWTDIRKQLHLEDVVGLRVDILTTSIQHEFDIAECLEFAFCQQSLVLLADCEPDPHRGGRCEDKCDKHDDYQEFFGDYHSQLLY